MNSVTTLRSKLQCGKAKQYPFKIQSPRTMALFSALIAFLLTILFRRLAPFVYETNDDLLLRMIASGELSGTPEAHLHFIFYPAGLFLSLLYRLFPSLPWYGLFLYSSFLLTAFTVLFILLRREESPLKHGLTAILFSLISCAFLFPHIASLQFTTSAGIAAAGAIFSFFFSSSDPSFRETLKNHLGFFLLSAYTFCIRDQVLFMCLPFIGVIWFSKYLDARKLSDHPATDTSSPPRFIYKNSRQKNLIKLGILFLAVLASFLLIEKLAYHNNDWSAFRAYSAARASVYDYEGYPDYDSCEAVYRELSISRTSYEGASHRYSLLLDPAVNRHSMETLASISKQSGNISIDQLPEKLRDMASFYLERQRSDADKPLNLLVYRCYLLFIICALLSRKWKALRDILFLCVARMVIWSYLIYRGRLPIRVSQTIYLAELAVLFSIALGYRLWRLKNSSCMPGDTNTITNVIKNVSRRSAKITPVIKKSAHTTAKPTIQTLPHHPHNNSYLRQKLCCGAWALSVLILLYTCLCSGVPNAKKTAEQSIARLQFSESFVHMKEYFRAHPDCFYYLDTNSFAYFTEDALQMTPPEESNYLFMGGWAAKSPWYDKKLDHAGITDPAAALYKDSSVYAVFMDTEETNYDYLTDFYAENYPGVSIKVTETIDAGGGISFLILKGFPEETP